MPRIAPEIKLSDADRAHLEKLSRSHSAERRMVERAMILLACAEGKQNQRVASELGVSTVRVGKWRSRFALHGLPGLNDGQRPGKPAVHGTAFRDRLLAQLEKTPPDGLARWDCPALAEALGASKAAVWRALRKEGIHLHRARSWCISTDPEFAEKAADIVGLYLNPPLNALVLSVDEKPSIQALERRGGYVQTRDKTWVKAYKSTYKRHGTLNLFAALNVATGEVKGQTTQTKTRDDFRRFMASVIEDEPPHREIHVILDNYCTHKRNGDWLATCGRPVYFHYTPTSASWLNQIEIWFGILSRKTLKQASFTSTDDLKNAIEAFINRHNQQAQPFKWRRREVKGSQIKNTITNLRN
jgi:transposase